MDGNRSGGDGVGGDVGAWIGVVGEGWLVGGDGRVC